MLYRHLRKLQWYFVTRAISIILLGYSMAIEDDPGNRGTMVTAAIGLLAAEPVARRNERPRRDDQ